MSSRKPTTSQTKAAKKRAAARQERRKNRRSPRGRKSTAKTSSQSRLLQGFLWVVFFPFMLIGKLTTNWKAWIKWPTRLILSAGFIGLTALLAIATVYYLRALPHDMDKIAEMPARSIVYARDGKTQLGKVHGDNRLVVPLEEVSAYFPQALVAREDARFYSHYGVDFRGIARILYLAITEGKRQGASTLSMQLARNTFSLGGKTIDRKLLEIAVALRIEAAYQKDEIMEHYVNRIFWGHSMLGIQAASNAYFEKPASELTLGESAMLAGIIRGPNIFSPFKSLEKAKQERDITLGRMVHYGFITQAERDIAANEDPHIRPPHRRGSSNSYAMDAVQRELDRILEDHNIQYGGLQIFTTIDSNLQLKAEESLDRHLRSIERLSGYKHPTRTAFSSQNISQRKAPQYLQGAVVCIENKTGAVVSVVGGRNADESRYNRAIYAQRQVGSIFKPFVYLSAFDQGMQPGQWISDRRIQPGEIKGAQRSWSPANSNGKYSQAVEVRDALAESRNTSSVRVGNSAGLDNVRKLASMVGFKDKVPNTPSAYLGSFGASPWDVAAAYTIFPNGGVKYRPYMIERILDREGNTVYPGAGQLPYIAASPGATWNVSNTLNEVVESGTARTLSSEHGFNFDAGGKTGTTNDYHDAWFAGFTSSLTCAVWVGLDKPQRTINKGYGSRLAMPVWANIMKYASGGDYPAQSLRPNFPFQSAELCRLTSQHATDGCRAAGFAYRAQIPADENPPHTCDFHPIKAQQIPESRPPRAIPVR